MINFFRKIRKKLADDNKPLKYARYAIGEIVLVVIGILIALQINNWNENRKVDLLEKDLLNEVKNGLEYDLVQLENAIDFQRSSLESQDIISDWVEGKIAYNDSLGIHFLHSIFNANVQFKEAPYTTLQQIGLQIIKNDSLRNQISNLYDLEYQNIYWWQDDYEKIKTRFRNSFADLGFDIKNQKNRSDGEIVPIDPLNLKSDSAFIFDLKGARAVLDIYTNDLMVKAQSEIMKTMEMIELELKKN
ncbi:MAG: DUF6090 family protein [Maribacter sp.]|nr:DUF6090 family protein [Maribacter sp.]